MAPQLRVSSQSIMDRLRSMASSPANTSMDQLLNQYATAANVLDGNKPDPLSEYLNAGGGGTTDPTAYPTGGGGNSFLPPEGIPYRPGPNTTTVEHVMPKQHYFSFEDEPLEGFDGGGRREPAGEFWAPDENGKLVHGWQSPINVDPLYTAQLWMANNGALMRQAQPMSEYGGKPLVFNKIPGAKSQLPPQAYDQSGKTSGFVKPNPGNHPEGSAPAAYSPSVTPNSAGAYTSLPMQYAASAVPAANPAAGDAIQSRLARLRKAAV